MSEWGNSKQLAEKLTDAGLEFSDALQWVNEIRLQAMAQGWAEGEKAGRTNERDKWYWQAGSPMRPKERPPMILPNPYEEDE